MANLVNQAALRGSADGKDAVTMKDFDWARDKIIMGNVIDHFVCVFVCMLVCVCARVHVCVCTTMHVCVCVCV